MRAKAFRSAFFAALVACAFAGVAGAQSPTPPQQQSAADERGIRETRVPLNEGAVAYDIEGRVALGAHLRTTQLAGSVDAPATNVRIVVDNRSGVFYNYASGWATFYDAGGVRCGEGLWKVEAFAPGESAETDAPGLRLTCAPATWRVTALNLLTRTSDTAKPGEPAAPGTSATQAPPSNVGAVAPPAETMGTMRAMGTAQRLEININGKSMPLQLGNPVDIIVGKERVLIVVRPAP